MDGISNIYLKLTRDLMFNIHEIDDDYDVFMAFETMNNRGKKLTNLESNVLLKIHHPKEKYSYFCQVENILLSMHHLSVFSNEPFPSHQTLLH